MAVRISRVRTINVRLSKEEYSELELACVASGSRSISDLVRSTMCGAAWDGNQYTALASSFNDLSKRLTDLKLSVNKHTEELASFRAGMTPQNAERPDTKFRNAVTEPLA